MEIDISFITVCKGRLNNLKQTLPLIASQSNSESIVVDYACPQGTRHWIRDNFPGVKTVAVDDPEFCVARGRNMGASAATAERFCFIDADIKIREGFVPWIRQHWQPRHHYRASPLGGDIWGTFVCAAEDFTRVGGYDEAIRGWGGEDDDIYMRLEDSGCRSSGFPAALLEPIRHDDAKRMTFYEIKDRGIHHRANQVYLAAKGDLTRFLGRPLSLKERTRLFEESQKGAAAIPVGAPAAVLEVSLPVDSRIPSPSEWALEHRVVYRILRRTP